MILGPLSAEKKPESGYSGFFYTSGPVQSDTAALLCRRFSGVVV